MSVWTDFGLTEPSLTSDGAPDAVDALEEVLRSLAELGPNVRRYGATGDYATDDSDAFINASADAATDNTVCLVPCPPGDGYLLDADVPLDSFVHWKNVGSKKRITGNYVGNERTPSVPIKFVNDHKFVNADFDENSSLTMEGLRVMGDNTVFDLRDAFLPTFINSSFQLNAAPAVAGTPAVVLNNCINGVADRTVFGYYGSYDYRSVHMRNSGAPGNNLGSGTWTFLNCQFNGGGLWWEEERAEGFPGALTMINCIGQGMTQGLVHLNATTVGTWTGVTILNSTINDSSTPSTSALVDVGDNCILQDFNLSGAIYTPALRVRSGGTAQHGNIQHAYITSMAPFVFDGGSTRGEGVTVNAGGLIDYSGYLRLREVTAPASAPADSVHIYADDNGSGKTRTESKFSSGAAQQMAIQP